MTTIVYLVLGLIAVAFLVDAINQRRTRHLQQSGIYPHPGQGTAADIERLVALGRKIDAIKLHRQLHGTDLKSAKVAVDKIAERPELRQRR